MANTTTYDFKLCKEICDAVAEGNGQNIKTVLESKKEYPVWSTFRRWKRDHEELRTLYVNAVQDKADMADCEIEEIAKDLRAGKLDASTANVLIQTLKWKTAKYYPKMFGDKVDHTTGGEKLNPTSTPIVLADGRKIEDDIKELKDKE